MNFDLGCLPPEHRPQFGSISAVELIARILPFVEKADVSLVSDEWKVYQGEDLNKNMWKENAER